MPLFTMNEDLRAPDLNDAVGELRAKELDQSVNNSTTLILDDALVWDLVAGAVYSVTANVMYVCLAAADIKFVWFTPANASMLWHGTGINAGSVHANFANSGALAAQAFGGSDGSTARVARLTGTVITTDTAGEMGLAFAQNTANASDSTVLGGSFGVLRRIA